MRPRDCISGGLGFSLMCATLASIISVSGPTSVVARALTPFAVLCGVIAGGLFFAALFHWIED